MPAREPRNAVISTISTPKGDPRSIDSSKPLTPLVLRTVEDLDQLTVAYEANTTDLGTEDLIRTLPESVIKETTPDGPVKLYAVLVNAMDPDLFKIVIVGTESSTVFVFTHDELQFSVTVPLPSYTLIQAVANLYIHALDKGLEGYNAMMKILPGLFYKLFHAAIEDPCEMNFKAWHDNDHPVDLKLYLYPNDPNRNIVSSNGYCWDVNLNEYPGRQISRGYSLRKRELRQRSGKK